jgi:tetratricopeptide (TPR) repeat protein
MEERVFGEILSIEDEILHLDIRNIESNPLDYKAWNKLATDLLEKGNYYYFLYEKSKSEYAKEKLESIYDKSIVCSDKSLDLNPHNIDSWYNKGLALSNLGRYEKALKCYESVIEIDPDYFQVWNIIGSTLDYLGKFDEAIKCYERVIEKEPDNPIPLYNKGISLSNLGKFDEAIKCYERVIEKDPKNIEALNAKGLAFERLRKYNEAIMCYDVVIELDPKNIEALNAKGYALERLDKYEEAEQYYNRITEEYSNEIDDMDKKAMYYQNLNKYDEAITCYDRIISIDANNFNAWLNKGILFYKLNKYEKAIECYDRAIGLNKYEKEFKENGKSIDYYHQAIEKDPKNIEALNAKGLALEKLMRYDDAIHLFDLVIAQNPPFVIDIIIKKGDIFMIIVNYQAAEKSYIDALERDPHNISALNQLHTLYSNYTFQYDKAISITEQLLKSLSDQEAKIDTKLLLGQDLINIGNYKQGRKIVEETIKEIPNEFIKRQIIVRFLIIASYLLQGKTNEGVSMLHKFLTYYRNLDIDIKYEENQWNFKGLLNAINKNKHIERSTKKILHNLIDLLHGYTDSYKTLLIIIEETLNK